MAKPNPPCPVCGGRFRDGRCYDRLCDYNFKDDKCPHCHAKGLHFKEERPMKQPLKDGPAQAAIEQRFKCLHCGKGSSKPLWDY